VGNRTVREATFDVFRRRGLTVLFSNPGSTEVPFLVDFPDDVQFVLALHEGSVVGMATGYALGRSEPALVVLHTLSGLGNAVGALATARLNRAPLVVLVGQQDRRHLATEPFTAGRLAALAGDYPVWVGEPARPQDVPAAVSRAYHEAGHGLGPALVIIPMDDWSAPADDRPETAPGRVLVASAADEHAAQDVAAMLASSSSPALVAGARSDDAATWEALVSLAEKLHAPVFQESFGARAGFPQDHPLFAGHLPADRARLRNTLGGHDVVLVIGAPAFRQYPYADGPFAPDGVRVAVVSDDPAEVHRSTAELGIVAPPAALVERVAQLVPARDGGAPEPRTGPAPMPPPARGEPLRAGHVLAALAERLPADAIVVEETPSSRPELHARLPARAPLGFVSAAMGGLGFALPAAAGLKLALPDRPVIAVVGDGSSLYSIQALWSAAHYGAGAVFVILSNGGYAVMDRLAEQQGKPAAWPPFDIDVSAIAQSFGCAARRIAEHEELVAAFDEVLPGAAARTEPILLEVAVAPDETFAP
jgi:thiamine pyrophosphate-dependent acetolactate synthase large subunit-like protein